MRFAFLTITMLVLVSMSCSGSSAPTVPSEPVADLPSWNISVDGQDYVVGPGDLLNDRQVAEVDPGTDMVADELRMYFAVNITQTNFPGFWECVIFKFYLYPLLQQQPDEVMFSWVDMLEASGTDVPQSLTVGPIC